MKLKKTKITTALILPDIHYPTHDKHALDIVMQVAKDLKPDDIFNISKEY